MIWKTLTTMPQKQKKSNYLCSKSKFEAFKLVQTGKGPLPSCLPLQVVRGPFQPYTTRRETRMTPNLKIPRLTQSVTTRRMSGTTRSPMTPRITNPNSKRRCASDQRKLKARRRSQKRKRRLLNVL